MKISVIKKYNPICVEDQIICLNSFDNNDLMMLKNMIVEICNGKTIILSEQSFIQTTDCKLILSLSSKNEGLKEISSDIYRCLLVKSEYLKMLDMIELSIEDNCSENSYSWLYDIDNPIDFLLSKNCKW